MLGACKPTRAVPREKMCKKERIRLDKRLRLREYCFMGNEIRYMSELFRIINGALRLDIDRVRNYTRKVRRFLPRQRRVFRVTHGFTPVVEVPVSGWRVAGRV